MSTANEDFLDRLVESLAEKIAARVEVILKAKRETRPVMKQLYTVREAAEYLGRSDKSIRNLVTRRLLPVIKYGRCVRFAQRDLDEFIERGRS